jgi:drug/metabolite transporter (DMT)-like permease
MNFPFPFQIFAWIASVVYAVEVVGTKLLSRHEIKNPWLLNFAYSGLVLVLTMPLALHYHAGFPARWTNVILAGIFWALANVFYILALYKLDLTTLSPLFNVRTGFAVLLAVLFLGEKISSLQAVLIALMFCGGVLVTLDERMSWRSLTSRGTLLAVLVMFAFTMDAVFIKKAIADEGFWTVTLWMPIIAQALFCLTLPRFASEVRRIGAKPWLFILFVALFDFIGNLAANRAYEKNVSISSAIITLPLSGVMAFILSLLVPKFLEKHTAKVYAARLIGTALIIWAGIKLS